jgi:hypothetical protein
MHAYARAWRACTHSDHPCPVCISRQASLNKKDARQGTAGVVRHPGLVGSRGNHSLTCAYGGDRYARHERVVRCIGGLATGVFMFWLNV